MLRFFVILLVLGAVGYAGYLVMFSEPEAVTPSVAPPEEPTGPTFDSNSFTANGLAAAYDANPVLAKAKLKDRILQISGRVKSIHIVTTERDRAELILEGTKRTSVRIEPSFKSGRVNPGIGKVLELMGGNLTLIDRREGKSEVLYRVGENVQMKVRVTGFGVTDISASEIK